MHEILASIINWTLNLVSDFGYLGIFFSMFMQSALIFIPSEIIIPFSGYLVSTQVFTVLGVVLSAVLGNFVGSLMAYYVGYWGKEVVVLKFIRKFGKWIFLSEEDFKKSMGWFKNRGEIITFISRFIPGIKPLISLSAGVSKMKIFKFTFYTTLGAFIWSLILVFLGKALGDNWEIVGEYAKKFEILILIFIVAFVVWYFWHKLNKHKKTNEA